MQNPKNIRVSMIEIDQVLRATNIIRAMSDGVPRSWIRPFDPSEGSQGRGRECEGIAVHAAREAFVAFFAATKGFNAEAFRRGCEVQG